MPEEKQNRNTKQKTMILSYLRERQNQHVRAEDILSDLKATETSVGKTTVYRVLKSLEAEGKIRKYTLSEKSPACYQYSGGQPECQHHYHLVCSQCSKLIHFDSALMEKIAAEMKRLEGFEVDESKTVFYGCCRECLEKGSTGGNNEN